MKAFVKMSSEEYHAHKAIGSTTLKLANESMAKFKAQVDGKIPKQETDYFNLGKAAHSAILEMDFKNYVCGPDVAKNTKIWKDFEAANPGKICLKEAQYNLVRGMYGAFNQHDLAPKIIHSGSAEASFFVNISGVEYKARPDYLVKEGERETEGYYIVDYKTTEDLEISAIQRAIGNYGYDLSAAHYINVVSAALEKPITEYYWIFQAKEPPFELGVFRFDDEGKDRARKCVNRLYAKISASTASGDWPPAFAPKIYDVDLPHYMTQTRIG